MDLSGKVSSNILPGRGLINPAFVIKIVPATDDLQQDRVCGRPNPSDDFLSNIATGDNVSFRKDKDVISGKINRIVKNSIGDVSYVIIIDETGETHKVEASRITARKNFKDDSNDDKMLSSPAVFNESILSFSSFLKYERVSTYKAF